MSPLDRLPRREVLAATVALLSTSSAGCALSDGTSKGATDVRVSNESTDPKSVSVTITGADSEQPRLETTLSLDPGKQTTPTASDKLPVGSDYTVEVDVEGGATDTYYWTDVSLDLAPLRVILSCNSEIYFELQSSERHL